MSAMPLPRDENMRSIMQRMRACMPLPCVLPAGCPDPLLLLLCRSVKPPCSGGTQSATAPALLRMSGPGPGWAAYLLTVTAFNLISDSCIVEPTCCMHARTQDILQYCRTGFGYYCCMGRQLDLFWRKLLLYHWKKFQCLMYL